MLSFPIDRPFPYDPFILCDTCGIVRARAGCHNRSPATCYHRRRMSERHDNCCTVLCSPDQAGPQGLSLQVCLLLKVLSKLHPVLLVQSLTQKKLGETLPTDHSQSYARGSSMRSRDWHHHDNRGKVWKPRLADHLVYPGMYRWNTSQTLSLFRCRSTKARPEAPLHCAACDIQHNPISPSGIMPPLRLSALISRREPIVSVISRD